MVVDHSEGKFCIYAKNESQKCHCGMDLKKCLKWKHGCPVKDVQEIDEQRTELTAVA